MAGSDRRLPEVRREHDFGKNSKSQHFIWHGYHLADARRVRQEKGIVDDAVPRYGFLKRIYLMSSCGPTSNQVMLVMLHLQSALPTFHGRRTQPSSRHLRECLPNCSTRSVLSIDGPIMKSHNFLELFTQHSMCST